MIDEASLLPVFRRAVEKAAEPAARRESEEELRNAAEKEKRREDKGVLIRAQRKLSLSRAREERKESYLRRLAGFDETRPQSFWVLGRNNRICSLRSRRANRR